ncbi:Fungal specific transcription factor domain-containing protein [Cladophialophora immunda]|nr:Fungal specific transcription factor domain-containing protein [Cladophialophora immunda]
MRYSKEIKKAPSSQGLRHDDFATQNRSTHQDEVYADSGQQLTAGSPQFCHLEGERLQLPSEQTLVEALPTTQNTAPMRDIPPSGTTPQTGIPQIPTFQARYLASEKSTSPPQTPDHGIDAGQNFERPSISTERIIAAGYPFLNTDFVSRIPPEDFEYLDQIGCFQLPGQNCLDELVRAYFLYLHPHLPMIDEGKFWETYLSSQSGAHHTASVSLFVFQAMMLVACSFVNSSTIQDLGFHSVREARSVYYRRVKALYDFDTERSDLAKAQGALLMTFHVPLNKPQINTYWLSIAIQLAKMDGADRYSTYAGPDFARHNQLKRVWWSCIIRDRTMSLGLRRPISIFSSSFDEAWPSLTDDDLKSEIGRSFVRSIPAKMKLLQSLSALCRLCAVLTDILQLLYPANGTHVSGDRVDVLKRIYTYTDELNEWYDAVASNIGPHDQHDKTFSVVTLYTSLLTIYFHSAKAALCNYRIMLTLNKSAQYNFERLQTKNELQDALRGIARSLRAIIDAGMMTYSPVSMVAFLALPSICYNLDLSSHASTQRNTRSRGTNIYQDFLRVLQLRYEGTDRALNNMSKLVGHMDLEDVTSPSTTRSRSENNATGHRDLSRPPGILAPAKRGSGIDIVTSDPQKYIQMSHTLDFFLSRGRFPTQYDNPPDLISSAAESHGSPSPSPMDDSVAGETNDTVERSHHPEGVELPGQGDAGPSIWPAPSPGSNDLLAPGEAGTGSTALSAMLAGDPFDQAASGLGFSFEDFMTDGPNSGIERLQSMLYTYPDWP